MCVEIQILSGARMGERLRLDATDFEAGGDPRCNVFFDPERDRDAAGTRMRFRRQPDGWYVERIAGGQLLNHDVLPKRSRLRSGDVVRMSIDGPDFLFLVRPEASAA